MCASSSGVGHACVCVCAGVLAVALLRGWSLQRHKTGLTEVRSILIPWYLASTTKENFAALVMLETHNKQKDVTLSIRTYQVAWAGRATSASKTRKHCTV